MLKKLMLLIVTGCVAAAIAQTPPPPPLIGGAHGQGVAAGLQNQNRRGEFKFEVRKVATPNGPKVLGNFAIEVGTPTTAGNPGERIGIKSIELLEFARNERVAEFAGKAMLKFRNAAGQVVEVRGRLSVRVADNKPGNVQPSNTNPPDRIKVRFVAAEDPNRVFEFEGNVVRGDIVVVGPPPAPAPVP